MAPAIRPTPQELALRLHAIQSTTVRPFADGSGPVIVAQRRVLFVELDGSMSDRTADWLNRLGWALDAGPFGTEVVQ